MKKDQFFEEFVAFATTFSQLKHDLTMKVKSADVTTLQYLILEQLAVSEPLTPSEISDCQQMSLPNVSRELKKLREKNLIEKHEDLSDKRKHVVCLSQNGKVMMNEAFAKMKVELFNAFHPTTLEQFEDISHALRLLNKTIFKKQTDMKKA
ncbi:MarR family winged helix-turn-helix transcriptional regulator [Bacillus sp. NPDC077027]|uniref:MarR family winged helix-turn-helix transcriptional regulator n=1 Tax=Bacillus sp. NPDC077027 TaxID=3390548 RepID=UPI003D00A7F4